MVQPIPSFSEGVYPQQTFPIQQKKFQDYAYQDSFYLFWQLSLWYFLSF